ncbi:MAG: hypothetical protein LQ341_007085 [Variospora aurantia]|nr:MAG: hypothetical protein LQ341_007085 [Variospora aurantia]
MTTSAVPLPFPVRFYDPKIQAPDSRGRTLTSILAWPDDRLEHSHDYIQILFPLPERSPFNFSAPVIDEQTFSQFRSKSELRDRLRDSFVRLLHFYGFELAPQVSTDEASDGKYRVNLGVDFPHASRNWVTRFDHNHLRITRIIRSCRILGLDDEAQAFHAALWRVNTERPGVISQKSFMFWARAAHRPLFLAPEDERDEGRHGEDFLYRYEEGRQVAAAIPQGVDS